MLKNRRILITGANGGIGIEITKKFLENNDNLFLLYHNKRSEIDTLNKDLNSKIQIFKVDLSITEEIANTMKQILQSGPIDVFIHSVTPPIEHLSFLQINWNTIQNDISIHTKSFFEIVQSIIPPMKENKHGKIISILSSYVNGAPPKNLTSYLMAKYSLLGLCKSLAVEIGQFGINVNCVSPSLVDTPLTNNLPSKLKELAVKQNPMYRLAQTSDVASTVFFLASNDSDYINGENILITGGSSIH